MSLTKISYILVLLLCVSCISKTKQNSNIGEDTQIQVDLSSSTDTLLLSSFVKEVEVLPLLIPEEEVIGEIRQVYFADSLLFVVDRRLQTVLCFNRQGQWKYTLNKVGGGPEEYLSISKFWIYKNVMYIYDKKRFRVNLYTLSGTYLRSISCEKYFSDITTVSDSTFLCFTPDDIVDNPKGIWLMNIQGDFMSSLLSYEENYPIVFTFWDYIYPDRQNTFCIYSPLDNTSYRYCNDTLQVNWRMQLKQKTIASYNGLSNSVDIKGECYVAVCMLDVLNWIWYIWGNKNGGEVKYMLYNKLNKKLQVSDNISLSGLNLTDLGRPVTSNLSTGMVTAIPGVNSYSLQFFYFSEK